VTPGGRETASIFARRRFAWGVRASGSDVEAKERSRGGSRGRRVRTRPLAPAACGGGLYRDALCRSTSRRAAPRGHRRAQGGSGPPPRGGALHRARVLRPAMCDAPNTRQRRADLKVRTTLNTAAGVPFKTRWPRPRWSPGITSSARTRSESDRRTAWPRFPERGRLYKAGRSYRGPATSRSSRDHKPDVERGSWSLAKLSAYKTDDLHHRASATPTKVFRPPAISCGPSAGAAGDRQSSYKDILKKGSTSVLQSGGENPDGAQDGVRPSRRLTPTHMPPRRPLPARLRPGLSASLVGPARSAAAGIASCAPACGATGLPDIYLKPARLSVARMGAAVCRLRPARGSARYLFDARPGTRRWGRCANPALSGGMPEATAAALREAAGCARSTRTPTCRADEPAPFRSAIANGPTGSGPLRVSTRKSTRTRRFTYSDPETGEPSGRPAVSAAGRGGNPGARAAAPAAETGRFSMNAWPQVTPSSAAAPKPPDEEPAQGEWPESSPRKGGALLLDGQRQIPCANGQYTVHRIEEGRRA